MYKTTEKKAFNNRVNMAQDNKQCTLHNNMLTCNLLIYVNA